MSDDAAQYVSVVDDTVIRMGILSSKGTPQAKRRELSITHNQDDSATGTAKFLVEVLEAGGVVSVAGVRLRAEALAWL